MPGGLEFMSRDVLSIELDASAYSINELYEVAPDVALTTSSRPNPLIDNGALNEAEFIDMRLSPQPSRAGVIFDIRWCDFANSNGEASIVEQLDQLAESTLVDVVIQLRQRAGQRGIARHHCTYRLVNEVADVRRFRVVRQGLPVRLCGELQKHQPENDVLILVGGHRAAQFLGGLPQRV
jgi:hypothetical protein